LQGFGAAIKHNLAALLARAGAHVDHAVCCQHHRRVMLHHHQRVARIAQALHGHDDAVHVARVQADAGFVQYEQGVDQRGAQCCGQVDALDFAAAQGAALAVQGEVADADVAQVLQSGADFFEQELEGFGFGFRGGWDGGMAGVLMVRKSQRPASASRSDRLHLVSRRKAVLGGVRLPDDSCTRTSPTQLPNCLQRIKEAPQLSNGINIMSCKHKPGSASSCARVHVTPCGMKRLAGRQHRIGLRLGANAPQQTLGLQPRPATGAARRVAAVLGQQHADVHLVGLGLQVLKEAVARRTSAGSTCRSSSGEPLMTQCCCSACELVPGRVARDAGGLGVAHQVVLALLPGGCLHGLDGTGAQGELVVGDDQASSPRRPPGQSHGRLSQAPTAELNENMEAIGSV